MVKTVTVPGEPEWAFELFTSRIDEWWPRATHSVGGDDAETVTVDPGEGGRVFEITSGGVEYEWGRITEWEPAAKVAFTWHPGSPTSQATHVEVTFRSTAEGTEVTLVHDGWEAREEDWQTMRDSYDTGWDHVLAQIPGSVPAPVTTPSQSRRHA